MELKNILFLALLTSCFAEEESAVTVRKLDEVVVVGKAENLLGNTTSASIGYTSREEILSRPTLRRGEIMESIPGMVVTQHAGEGKANQYFVRGYNLDHGTDFGSFIDGMQINNRTHAHGQGYTDVNFIMPELLKNLGYTKGPFFAKYGDLSTAGTADFQLVDRLERNFVTTSIGENNYYRAAFGQSLDLGQGALTLGGEVSYYDGPWDYAMNSKRYNAIARYFQGNDDEFLSFTFMSSVGKWNSPDQVAGRAIESGLIDRFGSLDDTDLGASQRHSFSMKFGHVIPNGPKITGGAYFGYYDFDLYSNFTYFLDDPVNGDQFRQRESRVFGGGDIAATWDDLRLMDKKAELSIGLQTRSDLINDIALTKTTRRKEREQVRKDDVFVGSFSAYAEGKMEFASWLRGTAGVRGDLFGFDVESDRAVNSGDETSGIISPKLGLVFGPWKNNEVYANIGMGFHSNDARGVTLNVDPETGDPANSVDPLVRTKGAELGLRSQFNDRLTSTLSFWYLENESELLFVGDAGNVEAVGGTHRYGVEWSTYLRPNDWITFDSEISVSKGFYDDEKDGKYIENQVPIVASIGATYGQDRGVFASLRGRYFSERPLLADNSLKSQDSFIVNARLGYRWDQWELSADCLNLLDRNDRDIEYGYESRLQSEAAGILESHYHPAEPRMFRLNATYYW
jgi:TonB-dependent Receptor Plug Domain